MAKLNAPLFSFGASGKIANALVYFPWKGLNVVRQYVVPSNPNTTLQATHRAYLAAAVAAIHVAQGVAAYPLVEADKTAYSAKGSTYPSPRTWFNQIVKFWLDVKVAVKIPVIYRNGGVGVTDNDDFRPNVYFTEATGSTLAAGKMYLGTSKTALVKSKACIIVAGVNAYLAEGAGFDDLVIGTKYFWQFRPDSGDGCVGADSGIYHAVATTP